MKKLLPVLFAIPPILLILYIFRPIQIQKPSEDTSIPVIQGNNLNEVQAELNKIVSDSMMYVSMNLAPQANIRDMEADLLIINPLSNGKKVQQVTLTLVETGEVIYTSPKLKPGENVVNAKIDKSLEVGSYPCIAHFENVDTGGVIAVELTLEVIADEA